MFFRILSIIPYEPDDISNSFYCVWYSIKSEHIELDYSENGIRFNFQCDWYVDLLPNGRFKGKGSVRHKEVINKTVEWLLKAVYEEKYNHLLLDVSPD